MKNDATSLDRLHDIVEPNPIPWWPPAPGWYVVIAVAAIGISWLAIRWWKSWKANAYRREALKELESLNDPAAIAQLLRRTALPTHSRSEVASLNGEDWTDWLSKQCQTKMPTQVSESLKVGVYNNKQNSDLPSLKAYATEWISHHECHVKGESPC